MSLSSILDWLLGNPRTEGRDDKHFLTLYRYMYYGEQGPRGESKVVAMVEKCRISPVACIKSSRMHLADDVTECPAAVLDENGLRYAEAYRLRPRRANEVAVQVLQAGICETDLQLVRGYMNYSGVLGHEFVGVALEGRWKGQRIVGEINCSCGNCDVCRSGLSNHCPWRSVVGILNHDGAFAKRLFIPEANLHGVPDQISNDQATLVEPLAAAFQIPTQVDLSQAKRAAVFGDGRLGYLCAQVLRQCGCFVRVIGKHPEKLQRFQTLGFDTVLHTECLTDDLFDLAVDCCGSVSGFESAIDCLRPRGTLVLKTTISGPHSTWLAPIVINEISVIGSRCGPFEKAIEGLCQQSIEVDSLISSRYPLSQITQAFQAATMAGQMKVIIDI